MKHFHKKRFKRWQISLFFIWQQKKRLNGSKKNARNYCAAWFILVSLCIPIFCDRFLSRAWCKTSEKHFGWHSLHLDCIWSCNSGRNIIRLETLLALECNPFRLWKCILCTSLNRIDEGREIYLLANDCVFN